MSFKINYFDLITIFEDAFGFSNFDATVIANYLDDCIDYELDLRKYIGNTLAFNSVCLKAGKKEALQYIEENLTVSVEDCTIYECDEVNGVYLEWC